jgi:LPS sulfotransferase NodH
MQPDRSYLVCATPRSGSTLVCHALEETGVAGRPEEYFEALRHSGRPRRPEEYFIGVDDHSINDHLGAAVPAPPPPAAVAVVEPCRLRPLPRLGLRGGNDA